VRFKEHSPQPDFLIRLVKVSAETMTGSFSGTVKEIASDQTITGIPMAYDFSSDNMKNVTAVSVNGLFDHTVPQKTKDTLRLEVKKIKVKDMAVAGSSDFPVMLDRGNVDFALDAAIINSTIQSKAKLTLTEARFSGKKGEELSRIETSIIRSLSKIPRIYVKTTTKGPLNDYNMKISSNIDEAIKNAVADFVEQEVAVWEKELQRAVKAEVEGQLKDLDIKISGIDGITDDLTERLNLGSKMLNF